MRIAVVSNQSRPTGKTALALLMGYVYPLAVGKVSAYLTNKSLSEVLKYTSCSDVETAIEKGISVFSALSQTESIKTGEVFDYAYKPKNTKLMLFDAYNTTVNTELAVGNFLNVLEMLGSTFTLVDLTGDVRSNDLKPILDACDVILYTFMCNHRDLEDFFVYYNELDENGQKKIIPVCTQWDDRGVKKKIIRDKTKIKPNKIMWIPYNQNITRLMLEGKLEDALRLMVDGKLSMLTMREPVTKVLSSILDSKAGKVVKEYSKWVI